MIRNAEEKDIPRIVDITNYYIRHSTANFEEHPTDAAEQLTVMRHVSDAGCPYLVWEDEASGLTLAYCYAHPWKIKSAYRLTLETTIYVDHACIGQGIGTRLYEELIAQCRAKGFHTLIADITDENEASIRMHERLGFKPVSHFREVGMKFGRWLGDIDMQLILS